MHRPAPHPLRRVAVAGASGLVGRALLHSLAADAQVQAVHAVLRRAPGPGVLPEAKTRAVFADPAGLGQPGAPALPAIDAAFCALGTTIQVAGSQAAFRAVDLDAVLAFARAARDAGAQRLGVVSALGADAASSVFYNRVKGEAEAALTAVGWPRLVIARPSLLLGDRGPLGQPSRPAERLAQAVTPAIGWLLPARLRPIRADVVAHALHRALAADGAAVQILESDALQRLGA
ncbi:NAD(P)H-binding protein [Ideonella sp. DXS22W]|uniref:NAD(P)H-binding protein n=1 Tax=Pseudaquabacterium inlustre TaxID=2984192 RepID=A0ABU9CET9_9BURK